MVNLETGNGKGTVKAYTTAAYYSGKVILKTGLKILLDETFDFTPATSFEKTIDIQDTDPKMLEVEILTSEGKKLVSWKPESQA